VFDFLGQANRLEGKVEGDRVVFSQDQLILPSHYQQQQHSDVVVFARPNELTIHTSQPAEPSLQATVVRDVWLAGQIRVELQDRQGRLLEVGLSAEQQQRLTLQPGQVVWVTANQLHIFNEHAA
jgi:sulfate transport system ATP-binding protein